MPAPEQIWGVELDDYGSTDWHESEASAREFVAKHPGTVLTLTTVQRFPHTSIELQQQFREQVK